MASKEDDSGCDICLESNVTAYCEDCNGYLCNSCFEKHALSRLFRGHSAKIVSEESAKDRNIQSLDKGNEMKGDDPGKCGKHVTENEVFYCDKHDKVICGRCVHADHRLCDGHIADLIEQSSNVDAGQTLSMLKELQENVNSKAIKNDENERNNRETTENCLEDVEKFRQQINARIDFLQCQIEEKAKNKSNANKVLIIDKSSVFEDTRQWLISKNEEIQNLSAKKQSLALCVALKRIEREMPEIRRKVEVADNRDTAMVFAFKGNVKLLTFLNETINDFGEIIDDVNGSDELVDNVSTLVKRENTKTKKAIGPRWFEYDTSSSEGVHRCSEDLLTTVYNVLKVANER
ncbi:hypothetical protein MAR_008534 [Mya arenaria]|uniref:B box-type domain-containing protein n=1 Tax=Mya arenaria TaxID=6604 RepID=A0ABY7E493_MYAAR|nr:tripartite motif-containing protein 45-like [Mya arenaria]WAR01976.1 hypothetical protein MAR_008534 [Mya arenaria]